VNKGLVLLAGKAHGLNEKLIAIESAYTVSGVRRVASEIETVEKVRAREVDAAVLALAGLRRLNLESEVAEIFDADRMIPAPGQGAVAVQIRADDEALASLLAPLNDETAAIETTAERAFGFLEAAVRCLPAPARGAATTFIVGLVVSLDGPDDPSRRAPSSRAWKTGR
jgi:porphobilinogen deaminase